MPKSYCEYGTYLEELDSDDCKHELEEACNQHNVADRFDGYNDALDDVLHH